MYKKLMNSEFDVVEHFNANMSDGTLDSNFKIVHMYSNTEKRDSRKQTVSIRATCFKNILFQDFVPISALHERYLAEIKASMSPTAFLAHLHRAELTGSSVYVIKNKKAVEGIVVEERKNVLTIVHADNSLKMYPKINNKFVLHHGGVRYFFFGAGMRKTRFFRK